FASYSASKFAVRGLTEALNIEWRRHGIVVSDIMPPFVNTPMIQNGPASKSFERMGIRLRPEQVAEVVWKAARGNKVHYPVGLQFKLLNALSAVSPDWLTRRVMRWIGGY
ncbi:MAG: SDR family NAD(P)-dependent oxidoreductase, partial [Calditrichaeota bacterium]|nr:SDR family NAD(P)-dependent oxidoreductase [Calditrichota bacterium]